MHYKAVVKYPRTKNRMNRAQTSPEPGTLLDARVNTVFSALPIL